MVLSLHLSAPRDCPPPSFLYTNFVHGGPVSLLGNIRRDYPRKVNFRNFSISISCSMPKIVRSRPLDGHVVKQNKIRFVQKLKTLLLSKPKQFIPIEILSKCRAYLSIHKPRSILSMIHRYPTIFEVFSIPFPPTPLNATKSYPQLCVRLTPAAAALAAKELKFKLEISTTLAQKLQKLLMMSSHQRLLLSKLVHLAPDLGLPPNFRSRLCNDHSDKFKTVDTSYGRALELVSRDPNLSKPLPVTQDHLPDLIVDRPLKFKHLRLRKGLNLKRHHQAFLLKFNEIPDICPYNTQIDDLAQASIEAEKRACAVVREVLGMMVEKRTLIDHLTHFRKEFGLPNQLRGLIMRHPELFYVSLKGDRNSVFLVEGFNDKGSLLEKDEALVIKDQWMELAKDSKRVRRERRRKQIYGSSDDYEVESDDDYDDNDDFEYDDDGFENLFESEELDFGNDYESPDSRDRSNSEFWTANTAEDLNDVHEGHKEPCGASGWGPSKFGCPP